MDILSQIEEALLLNEKLSKAVKDNIFELVIIFNNNFPEVSLEGLMERLKTLEISKLNKFLNHDVSMYDFRKNIIYFNPKEFEAGYDARLVMMYELLNVITATNFQVGFNVDNQFEALNIGYTSILANYLVGNSGEKQLYPEESVITNMMTIVVGPDTFKEAYFKNDPKILLEKMVSMGVSA